MIPPGFIQDLLARVDIVEVVGRHVELKKAGINHKGLCPFHGEKSPSFIVSPTRQTYHCFGCGVHGNAVGFLMEHGGVGFIDAVQDLAQQVGMQVPEDERSAEEIERAKLQKQRQTTLTEVLERASNHYRGQLKSSPRAIDYLKNRGLTGQIAAQFALGYAPEGWRALASAFPSYDDPLLTESGMVITQGDEGEEQKRYDRFRDRIMFPIRNVLGETIGFGGRVLDKGEPKYLNSPETPVFSKGRELYGLFEARAGLRQRGYALVVEGYIWMSSPWRSMALPMPWPPWAPHVRPNMSRSFSASQIRWSSVLMAMRLAVALPGAPWRPPCPMRPSYVRSSSCSCLPNMIRTPMCAS